MQAGTMLRFVVAPGHGTTAIAESSVVPGTCELYNG